MAELEGQKDIIVRLVNQISKEIKFPSLDDEWACRLPSLRSWMAAITAIAVERADSYRDFPRQVETGWTMGVDTVRRPGVNHMFRPETVTCEYQSWENRMLVTANESEISLEFSFGELNVKDMSTSVYQIAGVKILVDQYDQFDPGYFWAEFLPTGIDPELIQGRYSFRTGTLWKIDSLLEGEITQSLENIAYSVGHENREAAIALLDAKRDYEHGEEVAAHIRYLKGGDVYLSIGLGRPAY